MSFTPAVPWWSSSPPPSWSSPPRSCRRRRQRRGRRRRHRRGRRRRQRRGRRRRHASWSSSAPSSWSSPAGPSWSSSAGPSWCGRRGGGRGRRGRAEAQDEHGPLGGLLPAVELLLVAALAFVGVADQEAVQLVGVVGRLDLRRHVPRPPTGARRRRRRCPGAARLVAPRDRRLVPRRSEPDGSQGAAVDRTVGEHLQRRRLDDTAGRDRGRHPEADQRPGVLVGRLRRDLERRVSPLVGAG